MLYVYVYIQKQPYVVLLRLNILFLEFLSFYEKVV